MYIYNMKGDRALEIIIRNTGEQPIYEQIATQLKNQILTGRLQSGDPLPSMRLLAKELRISVITTKRAYEELERDGFIVSITGKGSFVAGQNAALMKEQKLRMIEMHLQEAAEQAAACGLNLQELIEMLSVLYQPDESGQ